MGGRFTRRRAGGTLLGLALALLVAPQACKDGDVPVRAVGDGCYVPTDCADPLVCVFQRCHQQCLADRDCSSGEICAGAEAPKRGVCLFPDESTCSRNSDCPLLAGHARLVCGRRGRCETQCANASDCLESQTCAQGSCVDRTLVPEGGPPPPAGKTGETCIQTSECNAPLVCKFGFCADECVTERDCLDAQTYACIDRTCHHVGSGPIDAGPDAPPGYGNPCIYPSECAFPLVCRASGVCGYECVTGKDCKATESCRDHACVVGSSSDSGTDGADGADGALDTGSGLACVADGDCKAGTYCKPERCVANKCVAAEGPCVSHAACTLDSCDEATKTCTHTPTTALDADGDAHTALACGGDDCDDKDATVYTGAGELCDRKDNDCDGLIDDYAVAPRPPGSLVTLKSSSSTALAVGPMGAKWLVALAGPTGLPGLSALSIDAAGTVSAEKSLETGNIDVGQLSATKDLAALVYAKTDGQRFAKLLRANLSEVATVALTSPSGSGTIAFDGGAAWNGAAFFLAWTNTDSTTQFAYLQPDGSLGSGVKYLPDGSNGATSAPIAVAARGAVHAVAYDSAATFHLQVMLLSSSGGKIALADIAGSATLRALVTTKTGFGVVWTQALGVGKMYFTPIATTGAKGGDVEIATSSSYFTQATAVADDGDGLAVEWRGTPDGALHFLWSDVGMLPSPPPFESTTPIAAIAPGASALGLLPGPQLGLFNLESGGKLRFLRIGCAP